MARRTKNSYGVVPFRSLECLSFLYLGSFCIWSIIIFLSSYIIYLSSRFCSLFYKWSCNVCLVTLFILTKFKNLGLVWWKENWRRSMGKNSLAIQLNSRENFSHGSSLISLTPNQPCAVTLVAFGTGQPWPWNIISVRLILRCSLYPSLLLEIDILRQKHSPTSF